MEWPFSATETLGIGTAFTACLFTYVFVRIENATSLQQSENKLPHLYDLISYGAVFIVFSFVAALPFPIYFLFVSLALNGSVFEGHWGHLVAVPFAFWAAKTVCRNSFPEVPTSHFYFYVSYTVLISVLVGLIPYIFGWDPFEGGPLVIPASFSLSDLAQMAGLAELFLTSQLSALTGAYLARQRGAARP